MPTYVYRCDCCGETRDVVLRLSERDTPVYCQGPNCTLTGLCRMTRVPTAASFTVQGFNAKNGYSKS
jgi:predicted nucleic acid-binding Zn ribbon protein